MLHSTDSHFTAGRPSALRLSRSVHHAHESGATRGQTPLATGAWTFPGFAEPEINSLWDANLLDRLSAPLTRYHE